MAITKEDGVMIAAAMAKAVAPLADAVHSLMKERASAAPPVKAASADEERVSALTKRVNELRDTLSELTKENIESVGVFEGCLGPDAIVGEYDGATFENVIPTGHREFETQEGGVFSGVLTSVPRRVKSAHAGGQVSKDAFGVQGLRAIPRRPVRERPKIKRTIGEI